jgi:hypothetical protein
MSPKGGVAPQTETLKISERIRIDIRYKRVLQTLARRRSMPFLELTSVCDIREENLAKIIKDLEDQDVVKVIDSGDITEEIITLKHKGFGIASSLAY